MSRTDSDFWPQLEASLKAIVGSQAERSVVINRHSGMVAVRATPDELRNVADYLQRIQQTVTRQVVLEAKIIEVELNSGYQAGINWAAVLKSGNQTYSGAQTAPHQTTMMTEIAKLVEGGKLGYLEPAAYDRTVKTLLTGKSDPVISKQPQGAYTHKVWEAAQK